MMTMVSLSKTSLFWVAVVVAAFLTPTAADVIDVGGKRGWAPNVNYTVWARHRRFHVGDLLVFRFDKNLYNVLEVTESSYENCNDREFITNITHGGRDVFQLGEARPYYFLSRGGYCFSGMKLAIYVDAFAPPPPGNDASTLFSATGFILPTILLATTLIWFL